MRRPEQHPALASHTLSHAANAQKVTVARQRVRVVAGTHSVQWYRSTAISGATTKSTRFITVLATRTLSSRHCQLARPGHDTVRLEVVVPQSTSLQVDRRTASRQTSDTSRRARTNRRVCVGSRRSHTDHCDDKQIGNSSSPSASRQSAEFRVARGCCGEVTCRRRCVRLRGAPHCRTGNEQHLDVYGSVPRLRSSYGVAAALAPPFASSKRPQIDVGTWPRPGRVASPDCGRRQSHWRLIADATILSHDASRGAKLTGAYSGSRHDRSPST